jgi:hypothetical protein
MGLRAAQSRLFAPFFFVAARGGIDGKEEEGLRKITAGGCAAEH